MPNHRSQKLGKRTQPTPLTGVEMVAISELKPDPRNPRTHSKKQIKKIGASIKKFGFNNPVLIDEQNQVMAGHGRLKAAEENGLKQVPVLRIEHLAEAEKRAYIIADNRLAEEAGWDREILAIELQGLLDGDFSVELTGFDTAEIDLRLAGADEANPPDSAIDDDLPLPPVPATATTRRGDYWQLGTHRLLCGDATSAPSYCNLLSGAKADLIIADPPYNVPINGHASGLGNVRHREFAMASGEMSNDEYRKFLERVLLKLAANSNDGAIHFIFMDWRHMPEVLGAGKSAYEELKNLCVWVKSNGGMGTFYRSRHELIFVFKNGTAPHINNFELGQMGRYRTNIWEYAGANSFGPGREEALAMHPTVKPVAMVADAIRDCSRHRQIVLDPFAGSGTTVIAAEKTGRRAYVIELDPLYCDTIIHRWQNFTGKQAINVDSGLTFEEIEDLRRVEKTDSSIAQPGNGRAERGS